MDKIFFEDSNWRGLILNGISLVLFIIGILQPTVAYFYFYGAGIVLFILNICRPFLFKHYIKYTENYIYINFKGIKGYRFKFKDIIRVDFLKNCLVIQNINGDLFVFNTKGIDLNDIKHLNDIINTFNSKRAKNNTAIFEKNGETHCKKIA